MKFSTDKKILDTKGCSTALTNRAKVACPSCHLEAKEVSAKTLKSLLRESIQSELSCFDGFYYCKTASCLTVYFRDTTVLTQEYISVSVGLKDGASPATLCYCFDWTKEKIKSELERTGETIALEDIKEKMHNSGCSCTLLNPSGGCCLSDTTKAIKEIKRQLLS